MGSFSDYLENELLDHVFKVGTWSPPTNLYIALCKSTIADDDTGSSLPTEVSGGSYARKVANSWVTAAAGATSNAAVLSFVEATAVWGTVTDFAIVDSGSGGNMLAYGKLTTPKKIGTGDTAKFATGEKHRPYSSNSGKPDLQKQIGNPEPSPVYWEGVETIRGGFAIANQEIVQTTNTLCGGESRGGTDIDVTLS